MTHLYFTSIIHSFVVKRFTLARINVLYSEVYFYWLHQNMFYICCKKGGSRCCSKNKLTTPNHCSHQQPCKGTKRFIEKTCIKTSSSRRVPLVEQELLTFRSTWAHLRCLVWFCVVLCRSLFVLFLLAIMLSVLFYGFWLPLGYLLNFISILHVHKYTYHQERQKYKLRVLASSIKWGCLYLYINIDLC
jgi:hypothetical protein